MQTSEPRLSIVIATYNAARTFEKCLASIVCQTFRDFEIIIADGLSTDGTIAIIEKYSDAIAYWHSHKDAGVYDAWNQAIEKSTGEYVCFIGADDFLSTPNSLEKIFNQISNLRYDLVLFRGNFIKSGSGKIYTVGAPWNHKTLIKMPICHPGMLHHRTLFDRIGEFNTEYRIASDYDFMLRLPESTKSLFIEENLISIGDGGISRNQYLKQMDEKRRIRSMHPKIGKLRAAFHYYNKLWRIPIAKILNIPY